jgi:hypothetical protein
MAAALDEEPHPCGRDQQLRVHPHQRRQRGHRSEPWTTRASSSSAQDGDLLAMNRDEAEALFMVLGGLLSIDE